MKERIILVMLVLFASFLSGAAFAEESKPDRPNILWLVMEDTSPYSIGCYGDPYAHTPNIDRIAAEGVRYTHAFSTNSSCAPSRSSLITGVLATCLGTGNQRTDHDIPDFIKGFPSFVQEAGYYTSNRYKTDYNTSAAKRLIRESWTKQGGKYEDRPKGKAFFSVINFEDSHQGREMGWSYEKYLERIRNKLSEEEQHVIEDASIPPYFPQTPISRRTMARVYDCTTMVDKQMGAVLDKLEHDGLADDTIIFIYADHGEGLPRAKCSPVFGYQIPLIVKFPKKYQHLAPSAPGTVCDDIVTFEDFGPTIISLAGGKIPSYMKGHVFLGKNNEPAARSYSFGSVHRTSHVIRSSRTIRTDRYQYNRNYIPHISEMHGTSYFDPAEITQEIKSCYQNGTLTGAALDFADPTTPPEELYDVVNDPHKVRNLVDSPEHRHILNELRGTMHQEIMQRRDVMFLPEHEMVLRSKGSTPYEIRTNDEEYPLESILAAAELVGGGSEVLPRQADFLNHPDDIVKYWALIGLISQGTEASGLLEQVVPLLRSPTADTRIAAATVLLSLGTHREEAGNVLKEELLHSTEPTAYSVLAAIEALRFLKEKAPDCTQELRQAYANRKKGKDRLSGYIRDAVLASGAHTEMPSSKKR
jgi:arylsulfatase A-like enzyme